MFVTEGKPCSDRRVTASTPIIISVLIVFLFHFAGKLAQLCDSSSKHFYQLLKIAVPEHELLEVAALVLREMLSQVCSVLGGRAVWGVGRVLPKTDRGFESRSVSSVLFFPMEAEALPRSVIRLSKGSCQMSKCLTKPVVKSLKDHNPHRNDEHPSAPFEPE